MGTLYIVVGSALSILAALVTALYTGIQGNGLIWSGFFIGFAIGAGWSALLLFGVPRAARKLKPLAQMGLSLASMLTVAAIIAVIYTQLRK